MRKRINPEKVAAYAEKPLNQKARLPEHLDATWINREHVRPLRKRIRYLDIGAAVCSVIAIIMFQVQIQSLQPLMPNCGESTARYVHKYQCTGLCAAMRVLVLLVSLVTIGILFMRYQTQVQIIRYQLNYQAVPQAKQAKDPHD